MTKPLMVAIRNVGEMDSPPLGTGTELADFISEVGQTPNVVGYYVDWTTDFLLTKPNYLLGLGITPSLTWEPWDHTVGGTSQPTYKLSTLTGGSKDAYITAFATAIKNWGHPIYLRLAHEMNGNWYPWCEGVNGNAAGDYLLFWRHVKNIFTSVGATNATFIWCPNVDPAHFFTALPGLYPGDAYVDEVGMDGYNFGVNTIEGWLLPTEIFSVTKSDIQAITSKPLRIWETGSVELGYVNYTLKDSFTGTLLNTGMWNGSSYGFVSESGGTAVIPCTTSYYVIGTTSTPKYDLTSHYCSVQVIPPAVGTGTKEHFLQCAIDASNYVEWILSGSSLLAISRVAGVNTTIATVAYNATTHAYWKIENSGANVVFSTSADGLSWTSQGTVATPFAITALDIYMGSGYFGTEAASNCLFDNFDSNLPRAVDTGTKPDWIDLLCSYMSSTPDVLSFLWFNFDNNLDNPAGADGTQPDFRIESSGASIAAFANCYGRTPSYTPVPISPGSSILQSAQLAQTALENCQKIAESEFGEFFQKKNGQMRLIARTGLVNQTPVAVFGDGGGSELGYRDLVPQYDDTLIRNPVTISRLDGVAQTAKDQAGIDEFFEAQFTLDGLYHNSDDISRSAAEFLVSEYKDPKRRIIGLTLGPSSDTALLTQMLALEIGDTVTIIERPQGVGLAITQNSVIEGISHTVGPKSWVTKLNVSPVLSTAVWQIGRPGYSELGLTTRLFF